MGQDILKRRCHDDKARYEYSRRTVRKGVSCDQSVMEYSNEEYCGIHLEFPLVYPVRRYPSAEVLLRPQQGLPET